MYEYVKQLSQAMTSKLPQSLVAQGVTPTIVHLTNANGMVLSFMDVGATWFSCVVPVAGKIRDVLLCSPDLQTFFSQGAYFGPIVGRYANRIAHSQFQLNGQTYQLQANDGVNSLHGGTQGYDQRVWKIVDRSANSVAFRLRSEDGDQGYPGNLDITVRYVLTDDNALKITYDAQSDADTYVNLTNHAYFNLMGEASGETVLQHKLRMAATHYLPTDDALIPIGEIVPVAGTPFDFQIEKPIEQDIHQGLCQERAGGYDHAFLFSQDRIDCQKPVIWLTAPDNSVSMQVSTSKPAVQFYSGQQLNNTPGKHGAYLPHTGMALETQCLPDGPNHKHWDQLNGFLASGAQYQHYTNYQFVF